MGLFDRVYIHCPQCGKRLEFQSKAGRCVLAEYDEDCVPVVIAKSISGDVEECPRCGTRVKAVENLCIATVAMHGVAVYTEEEDDSSAY